MWPTRTPARPIERMLRVMLAQRLAETFESEQVLLKPPPRELAAGQYPVGMIHYGKDGFYPFGLREDEFIQHIGIFGRSGSGKTNLAYLLLQGLTKAGKPFLVFDWKRNYRDLISSPVFGDLVIFTVGRECGAVPVQSPYPSPGHPGDCLAQETDRDHVPRLLPGGGGDGAPDASHRPPIPPGRAVR